MNLTQYYEIQKQKQSKFLGNHGLHDGEIVYDYRSGEAMIKMTKNGETRMMKLSDSKIRDHFDHSYATYLKYMKDDFLSDKERAYAIKTLRGNVSEANRIAAEEAEKKKRKAEAAKKRAAEDAKRIALLDEMIWELEQLGTPVVIPTGTFVLAKDITESDLRKLFGPRFAEWKAANREKNRKLSRKAMIEIENRWKDKKREARNYSTFPEDYDFMDFFKEEQELAKSDSEFFDADCYTCEF